MQHKDVQRCSEMFKMMRKLSREMKSVRTTVSARVDTLEGKADQANARADELDEGLARETVRLNVVECSVKTTNLRVDRLDARQADLTETMLRLGDVILRGLPLTGNESNEYLVGLVGKISTRVRSRLAPQDIIECVVLRGRKSGEGRPDASLLVRLVSPAVRREFFTKYIRHRPTLKTDQIGLNVSNRIVISDNLTKRNMEIKNKAIRAKMDGKIGRVSVRNGVVEAADLGGTLHTLYDEDDLVRLIGGQSPSRVNGSGGLKRNPFDA